MNPAPTPITIPIISASRYNRGVDGDRLPVPVGVLLAVGVTSDGNSNDKIYVVDIPLVLVNVTDN
jgi:hypothetical protein